MADETIDEFDDGLDVAEDGDVARLAKADLKALREAAKRGRNATTLEREMAFLKAGIDTDSKAGKIFMRGYDGELNPEAIRSEATEMGLGATPSTAAVEPEPENPDTELEPGEVEALGARRQAATSAEPHPERQRDPFEVAGEIHAQALSQGATHEDAMASAFAHLTSEAIQGNETVIAGRDGRLKTIQ